MIDPFLSGVPGDLSARVAVRALRAKRTGRTNPRFGPIASRAVGGMFEGRQRLSGRTTVGAGCGFISKRRLRKFARQVLSALMRNAGRDASFGQGLSSRG
ncbi:MAG: hypothetical protein WC975_13965 [Phycisphaerae bacterium]